MEARQMLSEGGMRTAMDESYINGVTNKWRKSGLLEGVQNPYHQGVLAVLLENQMDHLRSLNEDTLSTGVGQFTKYIFPILRRVFPNLIANQLVSVQPMTAPVGGIFTYEYKYGDEKGRATAGNNLIADFQKHFSSELIDYEVVVASASSAAGAYALDANNNVAERRPLQWLPIHPKDDQKGYIVRFTYTDQINDSQSIVDDGAGNLVLETSSTAGDVGQKVGVISYSTGEISFDFDSTGAPANISGAQQVNADSVPKAGSAIVVAYNFQSEKVSTTVTGQLDATKFASGSTASQQSKIPEVNIDIQLTTIEAITRKLKARWSAEAMDDLKAFHGLNAETELVAGISNEIALELDREIVDDLVTGSQFSATYNLANNAGLQVNNNELDQLRGLLTMIDSVSARIHRGSLRAPADFIVVPPEIGAILGQLTSHGDFMMVNRAMDPLEAPSYGPMNSAFGVHRLGTLMNKYTVYQDPFLSAGSANKQILVGLKGQSFLDAGYVYAPYVPLQVTPTFLDPDDFTFRKGLRTRYAKKMLRPEYYGTVNVSGLPTVLG